MATEYISRDDALDCFACDLGKKDRKISYQGFMVEAAFRINDIPAADVRPVVRAKWVRGNENRTSPIKDSYTCSVCGEKTLSGFCGNPAKTNFCPNCGADMREVKSDEK